MSFRRNDGICFETIEFNKYTRNFKEITDMKKIFILISFCVGLVFLVSCTGMQTNLEKNRGRAFEAAKYQQAVNPDAQSQEIVEGTHGLTGDASMKNYQDSFGKQDREEILKFKRQGKMFSK
jgi:hypothetical protein